MDAQETGTGLRADLAKRIEQGRWRQCSIFRPPEEYDGLPQHLNFTRGDWLIVCTQSCSVCGDDFSRDPVVEVMLARELQVLDRTLSQAMGRNFRELHIPIQGMPNVEGLACFISYRTLLPRYLLAEWKVSEANIAVPTLKAFQGWLAAHYTRIALPGNLVQRIRARGGLRDSVKKVLKQQIDGVPLNTRVQGFYLHWMPDSELPEDEHYSINLVVACTDDAAADALSDALRKLASGTRGRPVANGIIMEQPDVRPLDQITLAQIYKHMRFNEWDSFSDPEELISALAAS